MRIWILFAAVAATFTSGVQAQDTPPTETPQPLRLSVSETPQGNAVLPAGTQVPLRLIENVTTSGNDWETGDTFRLVVAHDIMVGQFIVIPAGSPAQGRITDLSSRGAFGRSGKMDIELEHIVVQGHLIDVNGSYRQEGDGATLATLGGVLVAGVFGGLVTGESATIPNGRELVATLENSLELDVLASEIEEDSRQISDADADWRTYHEFTDPSLSPSARVLQARQMRDAAIADARAAAAGQATIVAAQPPEPVIEGNNDEHSSDIEEAERIE